MTFLLAAMNDMYAVQITDRRLTSNGSLVDDEYEKCFSLWLPLYRFLIGFSGLAKAPAFSMTRFLMDQIAKLGHHHANPLALFHELANHLNQKFSSHPHIRMLEHSVKATSVSIIGYNYSGPKIQPIAGEIHNLTRAHKFEFFPSSLRECAAHDWTWVGMFGSGGPAAIHFENTIRTRLQASAPSAGICEMLEQMVLTSAGDPKSANTVGMNLDSLILPAKPNEPIIGGGYSNTCRYSLRIPSIVAIGPTGEVSQGRGILLTDASPNPAPMMVPKAHPSAPCPCGSGIKYKHCCGKRRRRRSQTGDRPKILPGLPGGAGLDAESAREAKRVTERPRCSPETT